MSKIPNILSKNTNKEQGENYKQSMHANSYQLHNQLPNAPVNNTETEELLFLPKDKQP